jgi:hypothetical protein
MVMIIQYFFIHLIDPFHEFLENHKADKVKFKKLIRVKLLVFLVKTKVLIKFIDNCSNVDPKDILIQNSNSAERRKLESNITYVFLGEKKQCIENYDKIGKNMHRFFFSLLKANDIKINYTESLHLINDPNYYEQIIGEAELEQVEKKINSLQTKDILGPMALFNFIGNTFNQNISDYAELHVCFPDPEFLYLYYKLIDSRWTGMGMSILSSSVKCIKKFYIPLTLFEEELVASKEYPQTRVRVLRDFDFLDIIDADFLVQKAFLNKRSLRKNLKKEFIEYFEYSLKKYSIFDREKIKGKF